MDILHRRAMAMIEGLGLEVSPNPLYDGYYGLIDFEFWARKNIGADAVEYLKKNVHPLDLAFRLAENQGIVLLNGGGFEAPDWSSARLSRQSSRRCVRRHRTGCSLDCAWISGRIRGFEARAQDVRALRATRMRHRRPRLSCQGAARTAPSPWLGMALDRAARGRVLRAGRPIPGVRRRRVRRARSKEHGPHRDPDARSIWSLATRRRSSA